MSERQLTILDQGRPVTVAARIDSTIRVSPEALERALGWKLETRGFCRGERCVPLRGGADLITSEGVDLIGFSELIGRPLAFDLDAAAAFLGTAADERAAQLRSLEAPDFSLPDLEGRRHSLSEHRGKKVLLVAYASW